MPAHWNTEDLLSRLRSRPEALEPGLRFLEQPLILGPDLQVELCGEDLLGRPVLVLPVTDQADRVCDRLLSLVAGLRGQRDRFSARFAQAGSPRALLIGEHYRSGLLDRLALLRAAIPVRSFLVEAGGTAEAPEPVFRLQAEGPAQSCAGLTDQLGPLERRLLERLLLAARSIQPPVVVLGDSWPLLFSGRHGCFAALHSDQGRLLLAWLGGPRERELLELQDDAAMDLAIDVLLRQQSDPITVRN